MLAVKGKSEGKWAAGGLWAIIRGPGHNSQGEKKLWTIWTLESQWGKDQKRISPLPNIHKEVLVSSVCELVVTPTSRMGTLGTFSWPCSPCCGYDIPPCKSGLHLRWCILYREQFRETADPLGSEDIFHKWSPELSCWEIPVGSLALRNWSNFPDYQRAQEEGSGRCPVSALLHLFWKCVISLSPALNTQQSLEITISAVSSQGFSEMANQYCHQPRKNTLCKVPSDSDFLGS